MDRKEVLFTDMTKFIPESSASAEYIVDTWQAVDYETANVKGKLIFADAKSDVPDIEIDPHLFGYYDVYIGMYINNRYSISSIMLGKLESEKNFTTCGAYYEGISEDNIDEFLWRSCDMTGEKITLKHVFEKQGHISEHCCSAVAFIRFVPITDDEYKKRKEEFKNNKRIFATHDIHGFMFEYNPQTSKEWFTIIDEYINSDVESLSIEYIRTHIKTNKNADTDKIFFHRRGDKNCYTCFKKFFESEENIYPMLIKRGKEIGLEMYMSFRMGQWGMGFPHGLYKNGIMYEKPHLKCMDRDGVYVDRMSYAYKEVREYLLGHFKTMMSYGADGISLLYTRGTPYVLFEQPVIDKFNKEYPDIDCRKLRNDDSRLQKVRAEIITDFMREVRALVDSFGENKKVNVHVHTSMKDDMYYGLDTKTWAEEGLVDKIIVNNDYHWENLDGDVWEDEEKSLIDIEKYKIWTETSPRIITCRNVYGHDIPKKTVDEYNELIDKTGVRVFYDLQRDDIESAKAEAIRLIDMGVKDICIWDTYHYKPWTRLWNFKSRLGNLDNVKKFDVNKFGRIHRIIVLDGKCVGRYCPWWGG